MTAVDQTPTPPSPSFRAGWAPWAAVAVDAVLVVLFVALGQREHTTANGVLGLLGTAAPFLVGLLLSSVATSFWRTWSRLWPQGLVVWLGTVAVGMVLRVLGGGGGAPLSFVLVAAVVLGVFLLGRRAVSRLLGRRRRR